MFVVVVVGESDPEEALEGSNVGVDDGEEEGIEEVGRIVVGEEEDGNSVGTEEGVGQIPQKPNNPIRYWIESDPTHTVVIDGMLGNAVV